MKYNLKSIVVGYEVPLLDLDDPTGQDELISELNNSLTPIDEVVSSSLDTREMHTSNHLFLLQYVFKVNTGDMTTDQLKEHFDDLKLKFETAIENFLKAREILFVKINVK